MGEYFIPDGCTVDRAGRLLTVRRQKKRLTGEGGDYRCQHCRHYASGHAVSNLYWTTTVCERKPKKIYKGTWLYYHVEATCRACDEFELREDFR